MTDLKLNMFTSLINQLFGNSNDVLIFVTIALACITAYYAIQTKRTVTVLEKTANMEFLPKIKGHIHMIGPVNLDLRVSNIGKGSATDVKVDLDFIGNNSITRTWIQPLLNPGQFQDFFIPVSENREQTDIPYFEANETKVSITATYNDILGNNHTTNEEINVSEFVRQFSRTMSVYDEGTVEKISKYLKIISEEMRNLSRSLHQG
ncbi:MAG TPA: hypothetical protein VJ772_06400 [Nitrososphaeraceae archaeon]|nr:hypothetical protein [Nitrososphaeraceae archaeon]